MYLSHPGTPQQPSNPPSANSVFFEGANRGATVDALIYVLTHGEGAEGVIKVTGDQGNGKTLLCRLLMERLPARMEIIYLAQPDSLREELLRSIAEKLNSSPARSGATTPPPTNTNAIDELESALSEKRIAGRRIVLLIDDAHTLPDDALEALSVLYDSQSRHHKLLQIILLGQAGLDSRLALPRMRKLRGNISHNYILTPLTAKVVKEYLTWRLRAAGNRGPDIFTLPAIKLITMASGGLIRQLDILADKSGLAASAAETREIQPIHVKAAALESGIKPRFSWASWRDAQDLPSPRVARASVIFSVTALLVLAVLGWDVLHTPPSDVTATTAPLPIGAVTSAPAAVLVPIPTTSTPVATMSSIGPPSVAAVIQSDPPGETTARMPASIPINPAPAAGQDNPAKINIAGVKLAGYALLEQRVAATQKIMGMTNGSSFTVQLFATENIQPDRMERFLVRARSLIDLSDLYVHPVTNGNQAKFRVTYGIYSSRDQANAAVPRLPERYRTSFQPEPYTLSEIH
ncbi:MAG: AAA family ATPase [Nitrosospira sp.]|nr:AAA family ATPase [Nitrosospira sp.]